MTKFGEFLKELRGSLSLREMEKKTGLSHTYLSSLEKGYDPRSKKERNPTPETLKKLSSSLGISYETLMMKAGYIDEDSYEIMERNENLVREYENLKQFVAKEKELLVKLSILKEKNGSSSEIDQIENEIEIIEDFKEQIEQIEDRFVKNLNQIQRKRFNDQERELYTILQKEHLTFQGIELSKEEIRNIFDFTYKMMEPKYNESILKKIDPFNRKDENFNNEVKE